MEGAEFYNRINNELDSLEPPISRTRTNGNCTKKPKPDLEVREYKSVADLPQTDYRRHPYVEPTLDFLFNLVGRKGVFPYEYIKSGEELNETQLPSKDSFLGKLRGDGISDVEYTHAHNVCNAFEINTMWDYHDLYLITDVLQLADILINFKKTCLESYNIDPLHSFTLPGFAWEAALKMTDVELDLLSDPICFYFLRRAFVEACL